MMSTVKSIGLMGLDGFELTVETDVSTGLPAFDVVGLADTAVKESRERVRAALKNSGFDFPVKRVTVNMAPADLKKEGPVYDLPILLGILAAQGLFCADLSGCAFVGELSLSGDLRPVTGVLSMALKARELGFERFFVPAENAREGSLATGIEVLGIGHFNDILKCFCEGAPLEAAFCDSEALLSLSQTDNLDFSDVRGQENVKRALEISAGGGHNMLLVGPPGSGKSMLAKRLPGILPSLSLDEALETTKIHSVAGVLPRDMGLLTRRPFRAPHHTISSVGLSGGGARPRPGEISLSHNGVLFLDELPEFSRSALEALRQPLEDSLVTISRASGSLTFPCNIMLICAMNPCRCGWFGHPTRKCSCSASDIDRYMSRISGPLLDRLDLHVSVSPVPFADLENNRPVEPSGEIKRRVEAARDLQRKRFLGTTVYSNARLTPAMSREYCKLDEASQRLLSDSFSRLGLSARARDRILKVARTIADLDASTDIQLIHVAEAISYRSIDPKSARY